MLPKLKWIQAAAVLCVLTPLWAQPQVLWEKDLESALAASKKQGKPLLISMHTSTEIACQRMLVAAQQGGRAMRSAAPSPTPVGREHAR